MNRWLRDLFRLSIVELLISCTAALLAILLRELLSCRWVSSVDQGRAQGQTGRLLLHIWRSWSRIREDSIGRADYTSVWEEVQVGVESGFVARLDDARLVNVLRSKHIGT